MSYRLHGLKIVLLIALCWGGNWDNAARAELWAGTGKVDITNRDEPFNDLLFVRALVVKNDQTTFTLLTLDAVSIGEIGYISNDYLPTVRAQIEQDWEILPTHVMANASHCHGVVCADVAERTVQAVRMAMESLVPVRVGVGTGHEDRVMENRRMKLKDGTEIDVRRGYALPPDESIAEVGPIDPQIGVLRLDKQDGSPLAVVYNFACHPIQGVPSGGSTADMTGFSSAVIEDNLGGGAVALFVQGCGGDINPVGYKAVDHPHDAEVLGNMLGLSTLKAARQIQTAVDDRLLVKHQMTELPRADLAQRIIAMEEERERLVNSLRGTELNLKTFMQLASKYSLASSFPSADSYRYLHQDALDRDHLRRMDALNRGAMKQYLRNIHTMEELTRLNTNLALLRKHQTELVDSGKRTIDVELLGVRIGDFVLTTFPGELTVQIGLNIKQAAPHPQTFVAGYTNGYIYYAPTAEQLKNVGRAQEDSDCVLAPEWQAIYEAAALQILEDL